MLRFNHIYANYVNKRKALYFYLNAGVCGLQRLKKVAYQDPTLVFHREKTNAETADAAIDGIMQ